MEPDTKEILTTVGIIVALLGLAYTAFNNRRQGKRERKELAYRRILSIREATFTPQIGHHLKTTYDDQPVADIQLLAYQFANSGTVPIKSEEYERDIELQFPDGTMILATGIGQVVPPDMPFSIETEGTTVRLSRSTFNAGSLATVVMRVTSCSELPAVRAYIVGTVVRELPPVPMPEDYIPLAVLSKHTSRPRLLAFAAFVIVIGVLKALGSILDPGGAWPVDGVVFGALLVSTSAIPETGRKAAEVKD